MITGEKVVLKGIMRDNVSEIYRWVNMEELRPLTGTVYPVSEYEHENWIERQTTSPDRKLFVVCDKENQKPLGTIGLKNIDWINRNVELFISLPELLKDKSIRGGVRNRCRFHSRQILFS